MKQTKSLINHENQFFLQITLSDAALFLEVSVSHWNRSCADHLFASTVPPDQVASLRAHSQVVDEVSCFFFCCCPQIAMMRKGAIVESVSLAKASVTDGFPRAGTDAERFAMGKKHPCKRLSNICATAALQVIQRAASNTLQLSQAPQLNYVLNNGG